MTLTEPFSIDAVIDKALELCQKLPDAKAYRLQTRNIENLRERLAEGRLQIAVLGQFNRGKSSFINTLLRMPVLPISVLPLTSIATEISYGETNSCTILFSDEKNDLVVTGNTAAISDCLLRYVTEENNPQNKHNVFSARVTCKSEFLKHGTVMIDTPGFGSTHIHNTGTTLKLLTACDAALFLFSADLPITQVEVDFLKQVIKTVPRLFFIFNKVDLLNDNELKKTQQFIKNALITHIGVPHDVPLFPVSVKQLAQNTDHSDLWQKSGFALIEKEIISFLQREKYFALSEALTGKFRNSLLAVIEVLKEKHDQCIAPLSVLAKEVEKLRAVSKTIDTESQKAFSLADIEKKALLQHCESLHESKRDLFDKALMTKIDAFFTSKNENFSQSAFQTFLQQLFEEMIQRIAVSLMAALNKPLHNAAIAHVRELVMISTTVNKELGIAADSVQANAYDTIIDSMHIDTDNEWESATPCILDIPKASLIDRLINAEKHHRHLFEKCRQQLHAHGDLVFNELKHCLHTALDTAFHSCKLEMEKYYHSLQEQVHISIKEKKGSYEQMKISAEPQLMQLDTLIKEFQEVASLVV